MSLDWRRLLFRIKALGWRRPLYIVFFIPTMIHILGTVTLPDHSRMEPAAPVQKNSGEIIEDRQLTELRKLKNTPGFEQLGLDPDEMFVRTRKETIRNPLIKYLLEYTPGQLEHAIIRTIIKVEFYDPVVLKAYTAASVLILLSMVVLIRTNWSWVILPFAKAGLNIGGFLIFITVVAAPIFWFSLDYNIFGRMNGIFFRGPLYLFVLSTISLKVYDFNNPVYNRLITSFTSLTASASIIYIF